MLQLNTQKIFKNTFQNFTKYFKIVNNEKVYMNKISIDIEITSDTILENDLKYLKLISSNSYINSEEARINNNLFDNNQQINLTNFSSQKNQVSIKNLSYQLNNTKNLQKNIKSLLGSIDSTSKQVNLLNQNKTNITQQNIYEVITQKNNIHTLFFNLQYNSNEKENNKNIYDFIIYAFNSKDQIIDKYEIQSQNIISFKEKDLFKLEKSVEYADLSNTFEIKFNNDLSDNTKRIINLLSNPINIQLIKEYSIKNSVQLIKNIDIFEIYEGKIIEKKQIQFDLNSNNHELIFNNKIELSLNLNQIEVEYKVVIHDCFKNIFIYNKKQNNIQKVYNNSKKEYENKSLITNIQYDFDDLFIDFIFKKNIFEVNIKLYNILSNKNLHISSLKISNIELINNCFLDIEGFNKIDFKRNLYEIFNKKEDLNFYILNRDFKDKIENIILNNEKMKITFYDSITQKNVIIYKNVYVNYVNFYNKFNQSLTITNQNIDDYIKITNDLTYYNLNYKLSLKDLDLFKKFSSESTDLLSLNYDRFLNESNKEIFFNEINQIYNFYVILKKNIITNNQNIEKYELKRIQSEKDLIDINLIDDTNSLRDNILLQNVLYKKIFFESKMFVIPNNLFSISNKYQILSKIKQIISINNKYILNNEEEINQIYNILNRLNDKGISNLNNFEISFIYNLFSINETYARSNFKIINNFEYENRRINSHKKIYNNNNNLKFNITKINLDKYLEVDFYLNVEELNKYNIKNDSIIIFFNDLIRRKKIFFEKIYNVADNLLDTDVYDLFLNKNQLITQNDYDDIFYEMNTNSIFSYSFVSKDQIKLNVKINLKNCVKLINFINIIKSNNISSLNIKNTYVKIKFIDDNLLYVDEKYNKYNILISIDMPKSYIGFENLTDI